MKTFYTNIHHLGDKINVRAIVDGKREKYIEEFNPVVFVPTGRPTKFETLDNVKVDSIRPGTISETRAFIERNKKFAVPTYGYSEWSHQYIAENFDGCDYDLELIRICNIDIEVASEHGFPGVEDVREEIVAITFHDSLTQKYYVFGNSTFITNREDVVYYEAVDEEDLIRSFIDAFQEMSPDIITGWNVKFYDIPYLVRRIHKLFDQKYANKLSPNGFVREKIITLMGRENPTYQLSGISTLDYQDLYKKFTYVNQERYSLDHISFVELGTQKLSYDEYDSIHLFYQQDYQKFIEYNIRDVELVGLLEEKLRLIELAISMAYDSGINFEEVFSPVRVWDATIFNHLRKKNIVVPPMAPNTKDREYEGAYVKEPQVGMHNWIVSFDLNSLYPHLIMQYNISPETIKESRAYDISINDLIDKKAELADLSTQNLTMTANGTFYDISEQGFLPELMEKVYNDRTEAKNKELEYRKLNEENPKREYENEIAKYNTLQMAKKILLNSAYGALGNKYFRYFDVVQAESITTSGQLSIRWIERKINEWFWSHFPENGEIDYIVAADTDSVYVTFDHIVNTYLSDTVDTDKIVTFLDNISTQRVEPYITECYEELSEYMNSYSQKMFMSREVIADKGVWTAKKRYILNVYDNEGVRYSKPKLKVMGIEAVRSSTPSVCREEIYAIMEGIMNTDEETTINSIQDFKKRFSKLQAEEISFPRSCNNINNYRDISSIYSKGTPVHVKGALLYNYYLKEGGLDNRYQLVREGDKIKFVYLKVPNPFKDKVVSFVNSLPKEFELNKYIDYDLQFEKSFLDPIKNVLDAIGWKHEKTADLSSFF